MFVYYGQILHPQICNWPLFSVRHLLLRINHLDIYFLLHGLDDIIMHDQLGETNYTTLLLRGSPVLVPTQVNYLNHLYRKQ